MADEDAGRRSRLGARSVSTVSKRGAIYEVTLEALTALLRSRLPEGSEVVAARWNDFRNCLDIKVWGPSLPIVPEGDPYERRALEV